MYPYCTSRASTNNAIILFNYYLWANSHFYAIYIDIYSHFTSQKLYMYFHKKGIAVVFALFASYKSVNMIEKSNTIL